MIVGIRVSTFSVAALTLLSTTLGICVLSLLVPGCGPQKKGGALVRDCKLDEAQSGTLSGRWGTVPIPVAVQAGAFKPNDVGSIVKAAATWNGFFGASKGFYVINSDDGGIPNESGAARPSSVCSQAILQPDGAYNGQVVIFKKDVWTHANHNAIALTSFCPRPAKPYPLIVQAIMEVNYQDFFGEGKKAPDLQSIMLHEFGHLVGLDHSCENNSKRAGFPNCTAELPAPYLLAAMYPSVGFDEGNNGELRRSLSENDQGRANCLYQETVQDETR